MFKSGLIFNLTKWNQYKLRGNSHKMGKFGYFCSGICLVLFKNALLPFFSDWMDVLVQPLICFYFRGEHTKWNPPKIAKNTVRSGRSSSEASPARRRSGWANLKSWYEVFWLTKIGWCLMQLPPHFMLFSTVWQFIYSIYLVLLWLCRVARLDFFPQSFSRLSCICLCQSSGAWRILEIVFLTSF